MCKWNLHKFAEALAPALPLADSKAALEKYDELYKGYYEEGMRRFGAVHDRLVLDIYESVFDGCAVIFGGPEVLAFGGLIVLGLYWRCTTRQERKAFSTDLAPLCVL